MRFRRKRTSDGRKTSIGVTSAAAAKRKVDRRV